MPSACTRIWTEALTYTGFHHRVHQSLLVHMNAVSISTCGCCNVFKCAKVLDLLSSSVLLTGIGKRAAQHFVVTNSILVCVLTSFLWQKAIKNLFSLSFSLSLPQIFQLWQVSVLLCLIVRSDNSNCLFLMFVTSCLCVLASLKTFRILFLTV